MEEFADCMLIYVYNLYGGRPSFDTSCLQPELKAIDTYTKGLSNGK